MANPQRLLAFGTPILSEIAEEGREANSSLANLILARRKASEGLQQSNNAGWHSDLELLRWAADEVRPIVARIVRLADANTLDLQAAPGERRGWLLEAWANVNERGAWNAPHVHGGSYWSAVYYVQLGKGDGGEIVFDDPRSPALEMHAPFLRFRDEVGEQSISIRPVESLILLFPSWLRHSVTPWQGDGPRITIALNLSAPPLTRR